MSTERYITIRCDRCQNSETEDAAIMSERKFRKELADSGWKFESGRSRAHVSGKLDICGQCAEGRQ